VPEQLTPKLESLYGAGAQLFDVGSREEFAQKMADPTKQKTFYDALSQDYDLGTYEEYSTKINDEIQPIENIVEPKETSKEKTGTEKAFTTFIEKSFLQPGSSFKAGVYSASANITQVLGNLAKKGEELTGIKAGGLFSDLAKYYREKAEQSKAKGVPEGEGFIGDLSKAIYEGSGHLALDLPVIMSLGQWGLPIYSAIMGGGEAAGADESILKGVATGTVEGIALHTVLKGARYLPRGAGEASGGAIFGGLTLQAELQKPEGDVDWSNVAAQSLLGMALTAQGRRIPQREFITNIRNEFSKGKESFAKWAEKEGIPKENAEKFHSELKTRLDKTVTEAEKFKEENPKVVKQFELDISKDITPKEAETPVEAKLAQQKTISKPVADKKFFTDIYKNVEKQVNMGVVVKSGENFIVEKGKIKISHPKGEYEFEIPKDKEGLRDLKSTLLEAFRTPTGLERVLKKPSRFEGDVKEALDIIDKVETVPEWKRENAKKLLDSFGITHTKKVLRGEEVLKPNERVIESEITKLQETSDTYKTQIAELEKAETPDLNKINRLKESQKRVNTILEQDAQIKEGVLNFTPESVKKVYEGAVKTERFKFENLDNDLQNVGKDLGIDKTNFVAKFKQFVENRKKFTQDNQNFFKEAWGSAKKSWKEDGSFSLADRNKLIARAKMLEKENPRIGIEHRKWKKAIFGVNSLTKMSSQDIKRYNTFLEPGDKKTALDTKAEFAEGILDLPTPDITVPKAHVFKDRGLLFESERKPLHKKSDPSKERHHRLLSLSGMDRFVGSIGLKYNVDIYNKWYDLNEARQKSDYLYREVGSKFLSASNALKKGEWEKLSEYIYNDKNVKLNARQQKVYDEGRAYLDNPTVQLRTKLTRFLSWYKNPQVVQLKGVSKDVLFKAKEIYKNEGLDPLVEYLDKAEGFLRKDYWSEFSSDLRLDTPKRIGIGEGAKMDKDGEIIRPEKNAVKNLRRKIRADTQDIFMDKPLTEMVETINISDLPKNIKGKLIDATRGQLGYVPLKGPAKIASKGMSAIVRPALMRGWKWIRQSMQRELKMAHVHPFDMLKFQALILKSFFGAKRVAGFPIPKINMKTTTMTDFSKAPEWKKRFFLTNVFSKETIGSEEVLRGKTPILDKLGGIGEVTKKAENVYIDLDGVNRWSDFDPITTHIVKQLESGKPFKNIKGRIFWHAIPHGLQKRLLPEIDSGNYKYVASAIADNFIKQKTQWAYHRAEKSPYEQENLGYLAGRVTTWGRSIIHARVDAIKTFASGVKNKDSGEAAAGLRAIILYTAIAAGIENYILTPVRKKVSGFWGHGYDPVVSTFVMPGGLMEGTYELFTGAVGETFNLGNAWQKHLTGEISDKEFVKRSKRAASVIANSAEQIPRSAVLGYQVLINIANATLGKDDIKPMKVMAQKLLNLYNKQNPQKVYKAEDVQRDALEKLGTVFLDWEQEKKKFSTKVKTY